MDAPTDVALGGAGGGAGGIPDAGGTSSTGGASGAGGTKKGGAGGSGVDGGGGITSTGGTTATGGEGGTTKPDVGLDAVPDASPLLSGLLVYYTFDSASGSDIPDQSGKGNTGKLSGISGTGYDFVAGKVGKALSLHKAGPGYVSVPSTVFAKATDITIAVWVNVTTPQNWQRLIDVGVDAKISANTSTGTKYFNIVPKNDGSNLLFSITTNGYSNEQKLSAASLSASTWTHVAVVLSSGAAKLYINGSEATNSTPPTLHPADLGAIDYAFVGKSQFSNDPAFDGVVDELRVYDRALPATEVQALSAFAGP
jgi:hypothetical protein